MSNDWTMADREAVQEFYRNYYQEDILKLAERYPKEQSSLWIDASDLFQFDPNLHTDLQHMPEKVRRLFEEELAEYDIPVDIDLSGATVRFHQLQQTQKLDELRDDDVAKFVSVEGQVSKASAVRPVVKEAAWECVRCEVVSRRPVEGELTEPHQCDGCERQGPFRLDYQKSTVENHQLIRLKQPPEEASNSGQVGNEIDAHITGDLVGFVDAGERADIPGVLNVDHDGTDPTLDFYLDAWAVDKQDEGYRGVDVDDHIQDIRTLTSEENPFVMLAESIAPGIQGGETVDIETPWGETYNKYWWIRLAAGIANLFGSWRRPNGDGTYHRGSSHTLLMGDPATGKSTIMNAVTEISPRSAYESGKNATGPGLTATAVNDDFGDSQWSLEAGALVKAHNGVAAVDEIDKMNKDNLSRLHSALEKQRLEINKAGIDATLQCETSLLAAGNPENSRFSRYETNQSQIDIVGSLMDRFDLVYVLKDVPDEQKDREIASSKIQEWRESAKVARNELDADARETGNPAVPVETLQAWVAHARENYQPVLPAGEASKRLEDYYVEIRQQNSTEEDDEDAPVPATVRNLEGLLRLAEASARMRLSEEVELIDVEIAIALTKISLNDVGYDPETGKMDADYAQGRTSFSQQERVNKIKGLVKNLDTGSGAEKENVVETATEAGISEAKAEKTITSLKEKGDLYEPQTGSLQVV